MVTKPEEEQPAPETTKRKRRRETRWKVVARVDPQGEEGLRWIQLAWGRESPPAWKKALRKDG